MGSVVAVVSKTIDGVRASAVGSKNFQPLMLAAAGAQTPFSMRQVVLPLLELVPALAGYEYCDGKSSPCHPFIVTADELAGLVVASPRTYEQLKASGDWLTKVRQLLDEVIQDADSREWGRRIDFSRVRALIEAAKKELEYADSKWSAEEQVDGETIVQIVYGPQAAVDRYFLAVGHNVSEIRGHRDRSDMMPDDSRFAQLARLFGQSAGIFDQSVVITAMGDLLQLENLDLRVDAGKVEVPDAQALLAVLSTIAKGINNIPDETLHVAANQLDEVLEAVRRSNKVRTLVEGLRGTELTQLLSDLAQEVDESDVRFTNSARRILKAAIATATAELPKLITAVSKPQEPCVVRVLVLPIIGNPQQRHTVTASIRSISEGHSVAGHLVEADDLDGPADPALIETGSGGEESSVVGAGATGGQG